MNEDRDYLSHGRIATAMLIVVLLGVSFIPPCTVGGIALRRANILSDLVSFDDAPREERSAEIDEEEFRIDMEEVAERIEADTAPREVQTLYRWVEPQEQKLPAGRRLPDTARLAEAPVVPIEDFDTTGCGPLQAFYDALAEQGRTLRIAFMGDSFVEGDILTADLREQLQESYGGGGCGFAPVASPLTAFRRTVKTQSKGWTAYNVMQRRRAPETLAPYFYVSGWICQPTPGASVRWETTDFRRRLDSCATADIYFISRDDARIEVTVNDSLHRTFVVEGAAPVRRIEIGCDPIRSLDMRIAEGARGFIGYGASFGREGGVTVDNYSVRSNNGQALFWTNPSVNAQMNAHVGYDLVVLQYGLNIMQQGVHGYANYAAQISKMIAYVRQCFPTAAVLVMGVSDRSVRTDEGFEPMDALPYMVEAQRDAARRAGAAFWDTSAAMQAQGGMARFVAEGWAGKDYTHINYAGGRRVAYALVDAINAGVLAREAQRIRRHEPLQPIDSIRFRPLRPEIAAPLPRPNTPDTLGK